MIKSVFFLLLIGISIIYFVRSNEEMKQQLTINQLVEQMGQSIEVIGSAERENAIIPRFNQPKTIACVNAEFKVHDDIPEKLKQGIFLHASTYPAMIRFANATNQDDSKKDIRGLSIRLSDVKGKVLWGEEGYQDFIFNSYPALFVATPEDFLTFIQARQKDKKLGFFLNPFDLHLKSLWIVYKAREKHLSPLDIRFWSTVPFRLGDVAVKYSMIPCSKYKTTEAVNPGENQLRAALKAHLKKEDACFLFAVQIQTDPKSMPIEDASVIWDEELSSFIPLATITIKDQDFDTEKSLESCEKSSFNPWQSLAAHEPLGRMNEVRRSVYDNAEKFRNKE
ncbi:MAG: catalase [Sulfurovum sp.]|nr:MAG: catalase [Sulfurovum sp.]